MKLFTSYKLGGLELANRIVMAPMTRSRAIANIPNDLMAEYYRQRASAGLIITEGTAPSPNGLGYPRIPGIFNEMQVAGWKKVTDAVHQGGGKIFIQLMHTGRVSHPLNQPEGAEVLAPSSVKLDGEMYTDQEGPKPYPTPRAMTEQEILTAQDEYVKASKLAIEAGFDGVELHGANGYLIEQFINTATNKRTDSYGGSIENRTRFAIETARKVAAAIGAEKTAMRISPYGVFSGMEIYDDLDATYEYLAKELGKLKLVYIHMVDHSAMGAPEVPQKVKDTVREAFGGTFISSGGLDKKSAEEVLQNGQGDLVAFGRPFISNPDLVYRLEHDIELAQPDHNTFYTPGEEGYTTYPVAETVNS